MQTIIQVICSTGPSLRDAIGVDPRIARFGFTVSKHQTPGRSPGWTKVHSTEPDRAGAINVQWNPDSGMLTCRVVTKGSSKPGPIVGDLVNYLITRYPRRVQAVTVVPRRGGPARGG